MFPQGWGGGWLSNDGFGGWNNHTSFGRWAAELPLEHDFQANFIADFFENENLTFRQWLVWLRRWIWMLEARLDWDESRINALEARQIKTVDTTTIGWGSVGAWTNATSAWDAELNTMTYQSGGETITFSDSVKLSKEAQSESLVAGTDKFLWNADNAIVAHDDGIYAPDDMAALQEGYTHDSVQDSEITSLSQELYNVSESVASNTGELKSLSNDVNSLGSDINSLSSEENQLSGTVTTDINSLNNVDVGNHLSISADQNTLTLTRKKLDGTVMAPDNIAVNIGYLWDAIAPNYVNVDVEPYTIDGGNPTFDASNNRKAITPFTSIFDFQFINTHKQGQAGWQVDPTGNNPASWVLYSNDSDFIDGVNKENGKFFHDGIQCNVMKTNTEPNMFAGISSGRGAWGIRNGMAVFFMTAVFTNFYQFNNNDPACLVNNVHFNMNATVVNT